MANSARTQPGSTTEKELQDVDRQPLRDATAFYDKNKNIITGVIVGVVLIVGGYFGYKFLYLAPREKKASEKVFYAQQSFAKDSTQLVLKGDGQHLGVLKIMKDYSGTATANLCHYYAGMSYLKEGDFKNAIKYLKDFDGKGTLVSTAAYGGLGKAYMSTNDVKNGIDAYQKAIAVNDRDDAQTPMYLFELGMAFEKNNQPDKAVASYKRIRDDYPGSREAQDIDRYLAKLGELPK